jgi:multimeric flavodoxin WrbA
MKVIILNGSPKAHGNTATALHEVEHMLQQQGIGAEWIHVGHLQIHGCIACNKCWTSGICTFGDIVNEISEKMREADGLLIGSPVYFASPNGTLLSLLDRLFYSNLHADRTMKVGASVSIARRGGATTTIDVLNKYFLKTNMPVVPSQYWSIVHGTVSGEVVRDEEGMQTMRQLGLNMAFLTIKMKENNLFLPLFIQILKRTRRLLSKRKALVRPLDLKLRKEQMIT